MKIFPHFHFRFLLIATGCGIISITAPAESVGIAGRRMDTFIPGPELVASPLKTGKDPLDLRILAVYPHGTAGFRYDLEFIGYVPGKLNLSPWLVPKDGAKAVELPPLEVQITSALPEGLPGSLEAVDLRKKDPGRGYAVLFVLLVFAWLAGGIALFVAWLRSMRPIAPEMVAAAPTPAEQLQPWIQLALKGKLDAAGKAELERRVIGFWRDRLDLTALPPEEALRKIRDDTEAGRLLKLVENWLHNPAAPVSESEINEALKPYGQPS